MTEAETETVETPAEEPVEEVRDAGAILRKNKGLLADLAKMKDRAAALEDLARALGLDADALADPRAHIARRAEDRTASEHRARTIRDFALKAIAAEQRIVNGDVDELLAKVIADPKVTIGEDGKVSGLDALWRAAPKRAAPGLPSIESFKARPAKPAPDTFEKLVESGPEALASFARQSPGEYEKLREDWQRRLANPSARR